MRALRTGDVRVVWKLDRRGRTLAHLVNTVQNLSARGVGLRVLTGQGAQIEPPPPPAASRSASSRRGRPRRVAWVVRDAVDLRLAKENA